MSRKAMYLTLITLLSASLLIGACGRGPDTGHLGPKGSLGPQGDVGPKGDVGPQGDVGPSSENAIVIRRTGDPVKSEYAISGFSEVKVCDFFEANVRQGDTYRVTVEAEETLMPYIEVFARGKKLHVGLKSGYTFNMENVTKRVEVTLPTLAQATACNHSELRLEGFQAEDNLRLEATDFGFLVGSVEAGNLRVAVSNHSSLHLTGSASQVQGEVTGLSDADLTGLEAGELDIDTDTHSSLEQ